MSAAQVDPSLLVVACFSRHKGALEWAEAKLSEAFGPVGLVSADYSFHHTSYYEKTMGQGLIKRLISFQLLVASDSLPPIKLRTNQLESELAGQGVYPEARPVNLDPGLLQLGKLLLATTKDKDHRIYLGEGIYAEVTLRFQDKEYHPWPWTYADYREPMVLEFLRNARNDFKTRLGS